MKPTEQKVSAIKAAPALKRHIMMKVLLLCVTLTAPSPLMAANKKAVADFIAALPSKEGLTAIGHTQNLEAVKRLSDLNPNKSSQIESILADYEKCAAPIAAIKVRRTLENVAVRLSPKQLIKMTAFYRGTNNEKISLFVIKRDRGEKPTYEDYAIITELAVTYPLMDFFTVFNDEIAKFSQDKNFLTSVEACRITMRATLDRNTIKYQSVGS